KAIARVEADVARGVDVADAAVVEPTHQAAQRGLPLDAAGGVAVADAAPIRHVTHQAAHRRIVAVTGNGGADIAAGVGIADAAAIQVTHQTADLIGVVDTDAARGVGMADTAATHIAHQSADMAGARAIAVDIDRGIHVVDDAAAVGNTRQRAGIAAADQPDVPDRRAIEVVEQARAVVGGKTDGETVDDVIQPVEHAGESVAAAAVDHADGLEARAAQERDPTARAAGVDVRAQHVVACQVAADALQGGAVGIERGSEAGDDGPVDRTAVAAQHGLEAAGAGQVDLRVDVVAGGVACRHRALAVPQRKTGGAAAAQHRIDVDVVLRVERERVGAPARGVVDVDVAGRAAGAAAALDGDVAGGQRRGQRGAGHVAAAGGDGEVGGVDQPIAGLAAFRAGGDARAIGHLHVGAAGFNGTAIAAAGGAGIERAAD